MSKLSQPGFIRAFENGGQPPIQGPEAGGGLAPLLLCNVVCYVRETT